MDNEELCGGGGGGGKLTNICLDFQVSLHKFLYVHETTLNLCLKLIFKYIWTILFYIYESL